MGGETAVSSPGTVVFPENVSGGTAGKAVAVLTGLSGTTQPLMISQADREVGRGSGDWLSVGTAAFGRLDMELNKRASCGHQIAATNETEITTIVIIESAANPTRRPSPGCNSVSPGCGSFPGGGATSL